MRLEEEQRKEEAQNAILRGLSIAGEGNNEILAEANGVDGLCGSSESEWSDEDDAPESVCRYRYYNNMNKRQIKKSVNMQGILKIVLKQRITVESSS